MEAMMVGLAIGAVLWSYLFIWVFSLLGRALGFQPVAALWFGYACTVGMAMLRFWPPVGDSLLVVLLFVVVGPICVWLQRRKLRKNGVIS